MDESSFSIAQEYADSGDNKKAFNILNKMLRDDPHNIEGWLLASDIAINITTKEKILMRGLEHNPNNSMILERLEIISIWKEKEATFQTQIRNSTSGNLIKRKKGVQLLAISLIGVILCALIFTIIFFFPTNNYSTASIPTATVRSTSIPFNKDNYNQLYNPIQAVDKNPDKYIGALVNYLGRVFNIQETDDGTIIQAWIYDFSRDNWDTPATIVYFGNTTYIYEGDSIEIWGFVSGTYTGTNAFGGTFTQTLIVAEKIERLGIFR